MIWTASPTNPREATPPLLLQLALAAVPTLAFPFDALLRGMVAAQISLDALCAYLMLSRAVILDHVIRLGLPTPHDRPYRQPGSKGWTPQDIHRLIAWRVAGVHPEPIGQNLERVRSANAVRSKARRLGIQPPPRQALFRPAPEQLSLCLSATTAAPLSGAQVVAAFDPPASKPLETNKKSPPTNISEVDFSDLTWIGQIPCRRGRATANAGISTNHAAVYAIGVITCAAVDRFTIAKLLGLSESSYRTWRTRLGIPQIANKTAFTTVFDPEVGIETIKRNKLEIATSINSSNGRAPHLFWRLTSERQVRRAPSEREQRRRGDPTSNVLVTVVTRDILDAEARQRSAPPAVNNASTAPAAMRSRLHVIPPAPGRLGSPQTSTVPPVHALPGTSFAMSRASLGR